MGFYLVIVSILTLMVFGTIGYASAESSPPLLFKFGTFGQGNGQFDQPWGIDVDNSGNIHVSEYWNHRIEKFDSSGNYLSTIDTKGIYGYGCTNAPTNCDDDGQLNQPMGIDVDSSGNVWIVDLGNQRIQKFNSAGSFQLKFGAQGTGDGQFYSPKDITLDSSGNVWVADTNNNRIQKFDSNGNFLIKFGSTGSGQGQFNNAQSLAFDSSGNIYVVDHNNRRVQKFSSSGSFLLQFGSYGQGNGQFINPHYVAVDNSNNVYVTDREAHNVQKFDSNGNFIWKLGSQGSGDSQFNDPAGIVVDNSGKIYVVDKGNNRIQVFSNPPDTTKPTITPPSNISVTTSSSSGTTVTYSQPTATDNVGVVSGPTCSPASGSVFPIGTTTVTCTASDAAGNVASATFTVTVTLQNSSIPLISTDKLSYSTGNIVTITGSGFSPPSTIIINIMSSSGSIIQELSLFSTSVGSFQTVWVVPQQVVSDSYTIRAADNTKSSSITISITGIQTTNTVTVEMAKGSASNTNCGNLCFVPNIVTVPVGSTMAWKNVDSAGHTATDTNGSFDSSLVNAGKSFKHKFDTAGTFEYLCIVHPWMKGTVIVGGGSYGETPQLSVKTELPLYDQGDTVTVSGYIQNYNANNPSLVTLRVVGPLVHEDSSNIIMIKDIKPQTNGSFKDTFILSGPHWQKAGDYKIIVNYGTSRSETVFYYNGGSGSGTLTGTAYVKTDSFYYERGDTVRIYGKVDSYLENTPLILQIFYDGNRVHIAQTEVTKDRIFSYDMIVDGSYFTRAGSYTVTMQYGVTGDIYETSFDFQTTATAGTTGIFEVDTGGSGTFDVSYTIRGGMIKDMVVDTDILGLIVTIDADNDGSITLDLGRQWIDAKKVDGTDDTYIILIDGLEAQYQESSISPVSRLLTIQFQEGDYDIKIIGTYLLGQGNSSQPPTSEIELYTMTDKSDYDLGELVTLSVNVAGISTPQNVAFTVTDPFGTIVVSRTLTTDTNGNANTDFKIAESFKTGTYHIDATSFIDGWTYLDDSEFKITSQFNQIQMVSAQGTDQQGNPTSFTRGNMGFVKVQVSAEKSIATLITVNVFDSDLTPIGVGSLKTTLSSGQSELILSFLIPEDAVVGTADIYVNALSDWVSSGGIPQTGEFAGQVSIN